MLSATARCARTDRADAHGRGDCRAGAVGRIACPVAVLWRWSATRAVAALSALSRAVAAMTWLEPAVAFTIGAGHGAIVVGGGVSTTGGAAEMPILKAANAIVSGTARRDRSNEKPFMNPPEHRSCVPPVREIANG